MTQSRIEQLFLLSKEIVDSVSSEEVEATFKDMQELGIAKPPYNRFTVGLHVGDFFVVYNRKTGEKTRWEGDMSDRLCYYHYDFSSGQYVATMELPAYKTYKAIPNFHEWMLPSDPDDREYYRACSRGTLEALWKLLVVLLATRNVEKHVVHNRLAKFGVGKSKATYTTSLSLGPIVESVYEGKHSPGNGAPRRPHLRRGHIRRQHYGPKNAFEKKIWIEPMFINADETFINNRTAYNVNLGAKP